MKDKTLRYMLKKESIITCFVIVFVIVMWQIISFFRIGDSGTVMTADLIMFNSIFYVCFPTITISQYMNFGFSRKRFFNNQMILCLMRSVMLAIVRTAIQISYYDDYVVMFMEDTDHTISMYHTVPIFELFISNVIIFMILYMICHLISIINSKVLWFEYAETPQAKYRFALAKQKSRIKKYAKKVLILVGFVAVIAGEIGVMMFYWFEMLYPLIYRIGIIAAMCVILAGLYAVGRYLYRPKYI